MGLRRIYQILFGYYSMNAFEIMYPLLLAAGGVWIGEWVAARGARAQLSPAEQAQVRYFVPSYGQAGALEQLGRDRGLTPVHCTHNTWFLWGPPEDPVDVAIVVGNDPEALGELFEEVELAALHDCDLCMPWRDHMPIWICRGAKGRVADRWAEWKAYE